MNNNNSATKNNYTTKKGDAEIVSICINSHKKKNSLYELKLPQLKIVIFITKIFVLLYHNIIWNKTIYM